MNGGVVNMSKWLPTQCPLLDRTAPSQSRACERRYEKGARVIHKRELGKALPNAAESFQVSVKSFGVGAHQTAAHRSPSAIFDSRKSASGSSTRDLGPHDTGTPTTIFLGRPSAVRAYAESMLHSSPRDVQAPTRKIRTSSFSSPPSPDKDLLEFGSDFQRDGARTATPSLGVGRPSQSAWGTPISSALRRTPSRQAYVQ